MARVTPEMIARALDTFEDIRSTYRHPAETMRRALEAALAEPVAPEPDAQLVAMAKAMWELYSEPGDEDETWERGPTADDRERLIEQAAAARLALVEQWAKEPPAELVGEAFAVPGETPYACAQRVGERFRALAARYRGGAK